MTLKIEQYTRKPFPVDAVQVTEENLNEVAKWCGGDIHTSTKTLRNDAGEETGKIKLPFIKVDVHRPLNDRQTKAFVGDWVLKSDSGFKVYTLKAFDNSFQKKFVGESSETVGLLSTDATAVAAASERTDGEKVAIEDEPEMAGFPEPTNLYTFKDSLLQNGWSIPDAEFAAAQVDILVEQGAESDEAEKLVLDGVKSKEEVQA